MNKIKYFKGSILLFIITFIVIICMPYNISAKSNNKGNKYEKIKYTSEYKYCSGVDYNKNISNKTIKYISNTYKSIPKSIRNDVKKKGWKIKVSKDDLDKIYNYSREPGTTTVGMCDYTNKLIIVKRRTYDTLYNTSIYLLHEVGHFVNYHSGAYSSPTYRSKFQNIYNEEKAKFNRLQDRLNLMTTAHNTSNTSEYFAQTFAVYMKEPNKLKKSCPKTYKYIRKIVKNYPRLP